MIPVFVSAIRTKYFRLRRDVLYDIQEGSHDGEVYMVQIRMAGLECNQPIKDVLSEVCIRSLMTWLTVCFHYSCRELQLVSLRMKSRFCPPRPPGGPFKANIIGRYIGLYWCRCKKMFIGRIAEYDEESGKHTIHYNDGDVGAEDLGTACWRWVSVRLSTV